MTTGEKGSILTDMMTSTTAQDDCESSKSLSQNNECDVKTTIDDETAAVTAAAAADDAAADDEDTSTNENEKSLEHGNDKSSSETTTTATVTTTGDFRMKIQPKQARKRKRQFGVTSSNKDVFGTADKDEDNDNETGTTDKNNKLLLLSADEISNSKVGGSTGDDVGVDADVDDEDVNVHSHSVTGRITMSLSGSSSASSSDDDIDDEGEDTSSAATVRTSNVDIDTSSRRKQPQHEKVHNETIKATTTERQKNNKSVDEDDDEDNNNDNDNVEDKNQGNKHNKNGDGDDTTRKTFAMDDDSPDLEQKGETDINEGRVQSESQSKQRQHQQPEGWRVKLYRLNADGSWDDCGTGRILCLYKPKPNKESEDSGAVTSTDGGDNHNDNDDENDKTNNENSSSSSSSLSSNLTTAAVTTDASVYQELGEPTLCMHSEVSSSAATSTLSIQQQTHISSSNNSTGNPRILLRTRILLRDAYQRQGDNIITWCEPYLEEGNPAQGVDLALSFQDNAGCIDIWRQITDVQSKANERFRLKNGDKTGNNVGGGSNNIIGGGNIDSSNSDNGNNNSGMDVGNGRSLADLAHNVAAAHHANNLQRQELWVNVPSDGKNNQGNNNNNISNNHNNMNGDNNDENDQFEDAMGGMVAAYHDSVSPSGGSSALNPPTSPQLPNPPTLGALEEIADTIAGVQVRLLSISFFLFFTSINLFLQINKKSNLTCVMASNFSNGNRLQCT